MPQRALRACWKCGRTDCQCRQQARASRARGWAARGAKDFIDRLYDTVRWKLTRRAVLLRDLFCVDCKTEPSTECDHEVPARAYILQRGGDVEAFFDPCNLRGRCKACHSAKTAREVGFAGSH